MKTFLKAIDIYGGGINLTINRKEKIKTIAGGCFTLFTIFSLHIFAWFIGNDIFYKVRPFSYVDNQIISNYPKRYINKTIFPFAFGLTDYNSVPLIIENYIRYELIKKDFQISNKTGFFDLVNSTIIDYRACVPSDFPMINEKAFHAASLSGYVCPVSKDLFVQGYWSEKIVSFLSLSVKKCDYDLNPNFCATQEEIDKFIKERYININIITIENVLSVANYENPINPTLLILYKFLHTKNSKITNFMIQNNHLLTDFGFFIEAFEQKDFLKITELQTDVLEYDENVKEMMQMNIYSSNKSETYFRKYIKVTDILASLGGLIKVTIIIFTVLKMPLSKYEQFSLIYQNIISDENIFNNDNSCSSLNRNKLNGSNLFKDIREKEKINFNNYIIKEENKEYSFKSDVNALDGKIKSHKNNRKLNNSKFNNFNLIINNNEINNITKGNFTQSYYKNNEKINNLNNIIVSEQSKNIINSQIPVIPKNYNEERKLFNKIKNDNFIKKYFFKEFSYREKKDFDFISFFQCIDNTTSCEFVLGFVKYICGCKKSNHAKKYENIHLLNEKIKSILDINNLFQILIELDITKNSY